MINASAEACKTPDESAIKTFLAGEYAHVTYCSKTGNTCADSKNLCTSGCFPLAMTSILASYGQNVTPEEMANYLCTNHYSAANSVSYSTIVNSQSYQQHFNMTIEDIADTMDGLDLALSQNKSVIASVNSRSVFTRNMHYIAIIAKNGDKYYITNSSTGTIEGQKSGWYDRNYVKVNVIDAKNNGLWSVIPNDCSNQSSSGGSTSTGPTNPSGTMDDKYENFFPNLNGDVEDQCQTLFLKPNGDLNPLGEFVNDLFAFIKIAAPIAVIILSTLDYLKAIATSNADDVKKATQRTIKRAIFGLLIFFLPTLLDLLFNLFGLYDLSKCQIIS